MLLRVSQDKLSGHRNQRDEVINQSVMTKCYKPTVPIIWSVPVLVVPATKLAQIVDIRVQALVFIRVYLVMGQSQIAVSMPHVTCYRRVHV